MEVAMAAAMLMTWYFICWRLRILCWICVCRVSFLISFSSCHRVAAKLCQSWKSSSLHSLFYDFELCSCVSGRVVWVWIIIGRDEVNASISWLHILDFVAAFYIDFRVKLAIIGSTRTRLLDFFSITNHSRIYSLFLLLQLKYSIGSYFPPDWLGHFNPARVNYGLTISMEILIWSSNHNDCLPICHRSFVLFIAI